MVSNSQLSTDLNSTKQLNQLERSLNSSGRLGIENIVCVGVFIAAVAFFTVAASLTAIFDKTTLSATENRPLAGFPRLRNVKHDLPKFAQGFEKFYNDHFAFRMPLISARNFILWKTLNSSGDSQVMIGKDNWLYYAVPQEVAAQANLQPFSETDLLLWARALQSRKNFLAEHGIKYIYFVAPEKGSIFPEHLPARLAVHPGKSRLDQLQDYLREHTDVDFVDAKALMMKAKPGQFAIYHKPDTHWNPYGSFLVTQELVRHMHAYFPAVEQFSPFDYHIAKEKFIGDLGKMLGLGKLFAESCPVIYLDNEKGHPQADAKIAAVPDVWIPSFAWVNPDSHLPRLFVMRDSFFGYLTAYLAEKASFSEYHWNHKLMAPLVLTQKPDLVVHEMAERHLYVYTPENAPQFTVDQTHAAVSEKSLANFDNKFELKNVSVRRVNSNMLVTLQWRSLSEQVFNRKIPLHAMTDSGVVIANTEYDQDAFGRTVPAYSQWTDIVQIPNCDQSKISQLGISLHTPDGVSMGSTLAKKTDWGTARVLLNLKDLEKRDAQ